jgi:hypothetical protein
MCILSKVAESNELSWEINQASSSVECGWLNRAPASSTKSCRTSFNRNLNYSDLYSSRARQETISTSIDDIYPRQSRVSENVHGGVLYRGNTGRSIQNWISSCRYLTILTFHYSLFSSTWQLLPRCCFPCSAQRIPPETATHRFRQRNLPVPSILRQTL